MKKILLTILTTLLGSLTLVSCVKDSNVNNNKNNQNPSINNEQENNKLNKNNSNLNSQNTQKDDSNGTLKQERKETSTPNTQSNKKDSKSEDKKELTLNQDTKKEITSESSKQENQDDLSSKDAKDKEKNKLNEENEENSNINNQNAQKDDSNASLKQEDKENSTSNTESNKKDIESEAKNDLTLDQDTKKENTIDSSKQENQDNLSSKKEIQNDSTSKDTNVEEKNKLNEENKENSTINHQNVQKDDSKASLKQEGKENSASNTESTKKDSESEDKKELTLDQDTKKDNKIESSKQENQNDLTPKDEEDEEKNKQIIENQGDLSSNNTKVEEKDQESNNAFQEENIETIKEKIKNLEVYNMYENDNYTINYENLELKLGEKHTLSLVSKDTKEVIKNENLKFFVKVRYPYNTVYYQDEISKNVEEINISNDGQITLLKNPIKEKDIEVFISYKNYIYGSKIKLLSKTDEIKIKQNIEIEAALDDIVKDLKNLSDVEKVRKAHDWVVDNIVYQEGPNDQTLYSGIIEKRTVCAGYAKTFEAILNRLNIPNQIISGNILRSRERHAWNIVELDGEWYHVDTTWDDNEKNRGTYNYFLVHDDDLFNNRSFHNYKKNQLGQKYRYYMYSKKGLVAHNTNELEDVLKRQYNKTNTREQIFEFISPSSITYFDAEKILEKITKGRVMTSSSSGYRGYQHNKYTVKYIPIENSNKNVEVENIKALEFEKTKSKITPIQITLNQDIQLDKSNIFIKESNAIVKDIEKIDNKTYKIYLSSLDFVNGDIKLEIIKRNHTFEFLNDTVTVKVNKAKLPNATFTPTEYLEGILRNVNSNMKYRIGINEWKNIDHDNFKINNLGTVNVFIRDMGNEFLEKSDIQKIKIDMMKDPQNLKVIDGVIYGVDKTMEYKNKNSENWQDCTGRKIENLPKGTYLVRVKISGNSLPSNPMELEV